MRAAEQIMRGGGVRYLLRDLFTTAQTAPLTTPRTCDPGPGATTLVNTATGAVPATSGGKYVQTRPSSGATWGGEGWYSGPVTRTNGVTVYALFSSSLQGGYAPVSWLQSAALPAVAPTNGISMPNGSSGLAIGGGAAVTTTSVIPNSTTTQLAVVARGNGYLYLVRGGATFPNWTLLWVDSVGIDPVLYAGSQGFNSQLSVDTYTVIQKTGALARDFGKATSYQPVVTDSTIYTGSADGLDYISWTPATAETLSLYFRWADDSNTYRLDCAQTGGTIKLFRRVSGVDTELNSGKTQVWAAGVPVLIGVVHAGGDIRTFTQIRGGSVVAKHVATGETLNLSSTGVKAAGFAAASDLALWPRTFSGTDDVTLA